MIKTSFIQERSLRKLISFLDEENMPRFWKFVKQFIKFNIVGFASTVVFLGLYYLLLYFKLNYLLSYLTAFVISVICVFILSRRYVFKEQGDLLRRFVKVLITYGFTLALSTGIMYLLVDIFSISELIAPYLAFIVVIPVNFVLLKLWAFK